jgi:hypothetical protein
MLERPDAFNALVERFTAEGPAGGGDERGRPRGRRAAARS